MLHTNESEINLIFCMIETFSRQLFNKNTTDKNCHCMFYSKIHFFVIELHTINSTKFRSIFFSQPFIIRIYKQLVILILNNSSHKLCSWKTFAYHKKLPHGGDDGDFWMSKDDWLNEFEIMTMCILPEFFDGYTHHEVPINRKNLARNKSIKTQEFQSVLFQSQVL